MSSSSDSAHLQSHHILLDQADAAKQTDLRRGSKYDIYGTATKPFGESYRRSLLIQQDQDQDSGHGQEREDSPLDTDSVEETMGCSASKTEVALNEETVKGSFIHKDVKLATPDHVKLEGLNDPIISAVEKKAVNNNTYSKIKPEGLSDFQIIYGEDKKNNNNNNGYSTTDIYSEVKKTEKTESETTAAIEGLIQTPREKLMQQIRDWKDETKEPKENAYSTVAKVHNINKEGNKTRNKSEKEEENTSICGKNKDDKLINTVVTSNPVSFVEEEYSYEPEKREATSKLVVRSRSLANLDQNQFNYNSTISCTLKRPNTLKITTKPDGTIRYGLRQASSESDLLDEDSDGTPSQGTEIKNNYVNSIKNAFDAAIESQNPNKTGKAEAFDGLRQYFQDNKHGLQELLINNNVVIIEPFRHEPPRSPSEKSDSGSQRTCRITGATIKSPVSEQSKMFASANTLPRRHVKSRQNTRQGFYHPIKVNKELIDAELPDPDKVKTARELFEKVFKPTSTSETPSKKHPSKSFFNTITSKMRITPEVTVIQGGKQISNDKRRQGRFIIEQVMREDARRYPLQRRWTDSGSLSSGVSSDFSCDQDCEYHHHDGPHSGNNHEILEEYSSGDEDAEYIYPYDDDETHPVSTEVLQKIRACGTTVTYYGGKVISRSHGQYRSPMTMTIMDEIRQSGGISEGKKKFQSDEEPYLGVKFRLVKSNSCGSRLEIAGTEEDCGTKLISPRHESFRGKSIAEEVAEVKEEQTTTEDVEDDNQITSTEDEEDKAEADRYVTNVEVNSSKNPQVMTWAELKLKEARKQWHCAPEAVRTPPQDMEFETFEVLDESKPMKMEKNETGRG